MLEPSGLSAVGCILVRLHGGTKARQITVYADGTLAYFQATSEAKFVCYQIAKIESKHLVDCSKHKQKAMLVFAVPG